MWFEFGICVQLRGNSAALCGLKKGASVASVVADATLLYTRFLELLSARGYSKPPWFTPTELARSIRGPELAAIADQFVAAYQDLRFGGKPDAAPRLLVLLDELKRQA